jgi:hypothetical protein
VLSKYPGAGLLGIRVLEHLSTELSTKSVDISRVDRFLLGTSNTCSIIRRAHVNAVARGAANFISQGIEVVNPEARWHSPCHSAGTLCWARGLTPDRVPLCGHRHEGEPCLRDPAIALAVCDGVRRMTYAEQAAVRGISLPLG